MSHLDTAYQLGIQQAHADFEEHAKQAQLGLGGNIGGASRPVTPQVPPAPPAARPPAGIGPTPAPTPMPTPMPTPTPNTPVPMGGVR